MIVASAWISAGLVVGPHCVAVPQFVVEQPPSIDCLEISTDCLGIGKGCLGI
jgi:hypothetical protein